MERLPDPFVSLQGVLDSVVAAYAGANLREAANLLLIKLESEADFPPWYCSTRPKSAGVPDPATGAEWGKKLLQHAEFFGEPVVYPHEYWEINGYDLPSMPAISVHYFLYFGPTLGFRRADIAPFLTRNGIAHSLGAAGPDDGMASAAAGEGGASTGVDASRPAAVTAPVQRRFAQEKAIVAKLLELGFDPLQLPKAPAGKKSRAKQMVKAALVYTDDVFSKAWQRLRDQERIRDA